MSESEAFWVCFGEDRLIDNFIDKLLILNREKHADRVIAHSCRYRNVCTTFRAVV